MVLLKWRNEEDEEENEEEIKKEYISQIMG